MQALRRLGRDASERRATGLCLVEGRRVAEDVLDAGARVHVALVSSRLARQPGGDELVARLEAAIGRTDGVLEVSDRVLESVADTKSPQGLVLAVAAPRRPGLPPATGAPVLVAWELQDPGNVGTLVRSTLAFGAGALVVAAAPGGALIDAFSPRAVRSSAGACFRLPVHEWREEPGSAAASLRAAGLRLAACVAREGRAPEEVDLAGPVAIVVGSEAHGVPEPLAGGSDVRVTIPVARGVDSLNAAMAATVVLAESARQRRASG